MRLRLDPSSQSGLSPEPPKPTRGQVNGYVAKTERLGELLDVVIASTPLDNQALAYDTATSKWIPQTISGGGGGQVDSVVAGTGIAVDATDPTNPIAALSTGSIASLALADTATQPGDLATVATTGAYSDLTGAPTIPVISDTAYNATTWNANTDGATKNAIRDKVETMDAAIALNTAKNTYPSADATKVGHISVTQAVNLDTMESDIATNNAKITYPSSASTKLATIETNADVTDATNVAAAGAAIPTGTPDGTKFLRDDSVWTAIPGGGDALTANPLSQFASTTSAQLAGVISNETGSGALVFGTSPTLVTPALGTPSALVGTNITGTAAGLTVGATTGVEAGADVTDTANVTSAGALMDSEVTNLAEVKAFDSTDYAAALGADDNYVTDAEKTVIGNTSGTNTGDNATNTQYSGLVSNANHTGDATGSTALTLATVNSNVGAFTNANVTVNAKGLITAVANGSSGGTVDVLSNVATDRIIGRTTAGSGDSEELTPAATRTLLNVADGATANTGDVVGPASSTDNAIARYDSTTGKLLQNSGVLVGDDDSVYADYFVANSDGYGFGGVQTDTIGEKTASSGVTVDGVLLKDGGLNGIPIATTTGTQTLTNKTLTSPVVNSPTGIVKADVGLANVDNTTDAGKPVSTAQQTALNLKANLASPTFTGTVSGVTSTMVGLGNVSNTSNATERAATATLTNKDLASSTNTFPDFYPVGTQYTNSTNAANPSTYLPGQSASTWVADSGTVTVAKAASGTFGTIGATGGAETHTHALSNNGQAKIAVSASRVHAGMVAASFTETLRRGGLSADTAATYTEAAGLMGATDSGSTLMPYIVKYVWNRTA